MTTIKQDIASLLVWIVILVILSYGISRIG